MASVVIVKALLGDDAALRDHIISYDWSTLENRSHRLIPDAPCPVCWNGKQEPTRPEAPQLKSRHPGAAIDGGYRMRPAGETLESLEGLISPIVGPIRSMLPLDPNEGFKQEMKGTRLPAFYGSIHRFPPGSVSPRIGSDRLQVATSVGKGLTDIQARVSCLAEAVERMSGCYRGDEYTETAAFSDISGRAIHPNTFQHFSDRQYAKGNGGVTSPYQRVPHQLGDDQPVAWSPVWSLTRQDWRLFPTACLYYGYAPSRSPRWFGSANSNGDAAGNCREEAILRGLFELVERDAVAIWWYNMLRCPGVDLASAGAEIQELCEAYDALGRNLWVLDITHDLGIPVYVAVSTARDGSSPALGLGAHLDARVALGRAITEMSQMMYLLGGSQGCGGDALLADAAPQYFLDELTLAEAPYLRPASGNTVVVGRHVCAGSGELRTDIEVLVDRFAKLGLETYVHDRSRPEFPLNVVKVIVPQLRHFWPRFGPGRLYDVPVALGWLPHARSEDQLNPRPILF